jgi:hypothetical protein
LQRLGIIRDTGHEHFNGSLVIPVLDEHGHESARQRGGTVTSTLG